MHVLRQTFRRLPRNIAAGLHNSAPATTLSRSSISRSFGCTSVVSDTFRASHSQINLTRGTGQKEPVDAGLSMSAVEVNVPMGLEAVLAPLAPLAPRVDAPQKLDAPLPLFAEYMPLALALALGAAAGGATTSCEDDDDDDDDDDGTAAIMSEIQQLQRAALKESTRKARRPRRCTSCATRPCRPLISFSSCML